MLHFKLAHLLIAKSMVEALLVAALAVGFYLTAFPPYFRGSAEATAHGIAGWVINQHAPWERVEVQLFVDDLFVASSKAELPRPDVLAAGFGRDEWHGYDFPLPPLPAGEHVARVYAVSTSGRGARKTLQLVGDAVRFGVDDQGISQQLPGQAVARREGVSIADFGLRNGD